MSIATPRSIARDGGWLAHAPAASVLLCDPYRHHLVEGRVGTPDVYVLPPAAKAYLGTKLGLGVNTGSVIWVHNVGAYAVSVQNADASFGVTLAANKSGAFALISGATAAGTWTRIALDKANGRGASQPDGFMFTLDLRRSQNAVHVLAEAIDAGYDGTIPAIARIYVRANVVLGSSSITVPSLDIGGDVAISGVNWYSGSLMFLGNAGVISGCGGRGGDGGIGGTGASDGTDGEAGGLAMRVPINLTVTNTGTIQGGGGGGGGGNGAAATAGLNGGSGGGGAGANVDASGYINGGQRGVLRAGATLADAGTLFLGGAFGWGSTVSPNVGGHGGIGGAPASVGGRGQTINNGPDDALGGVAGPAISRASAATITYIVSGTITGATVVA